MTPPKLTPEDVRVLQERRRSNAAGTHRNRGDKRQTKRTARERAVDEQMED